MLYLLPDEIKIHLCCLMAFMDCLSGFRLSVTGVPFWAMGGLESSLTWVLDILPFLFKACMELSMLAFGQFGFGYF